MPSAAVTPTSSLTPPSADDRTHVPTDCIARTRLKAVLLSLLLAECLHDSHAPEGLLHDSEGAAALFVDPFPAAS